MLTFVIHISERLKVRIFAATSNAYQHFDTLVHHRSVVGRNCAHQMSLRTKFERQKS